MTPHSLTTALAAPISTGESTTFWILATVAVLAALGVIFSRKAVHSTLLLALVMVILSTFYGINQAPFLMIVQVVVYTGAVLMLFLFVLMLVGVSSADSLVETIKGQRLLSGIVAVAFLGALSLGLTRIVVGDPVNLDSGTAAAGGNVPWIATEVFYRYIIAFEATGALLIVAVLGALVLAHQQRTGGRRTQREMSKERIRGNHPTALPGPGTYARHNAIDMPALLPDGSVAKLSLNPILAARDESPSEVPSEIRAAEEPEPGSASDSASSKEGQGDIDLPPGSPPPETQRHGGAHAHGENRGEER